MENLNVVKLVGIALLVALALSLGVGAKTVQAQILFGLAHLGKNGPSTLYTIDTTDGKATEIGPTGFERCSGMDFRAGTLTWPRVSAVNAFHSPLMFLPG